MSNTLSGQNTGMFPYNLDGLQNIDATSINGQQLDFSNLVQYSGNTADLDMGAYNIKTAHIAAANSDVVNLLSLTSRLSALTGYIFGINGLNYVPYSGGTSNTNLGIYGLSAGSITANSSLTVGGASILNGNITAISNLNVNGLTTLAHGQTNFTAVSSLDLTNKAYVDTSVATAIANITGGTNLLTTNNIFSGTNQFNNKVTLNTATAQGSLTVYNTTDSLPGGGSGSALAVYSATNTDSALLFGCASNTTFAIRSSGSLANPTLALYSPIVGGMLTLTQNEATMTHGGNSFSLGNTRFLTTTVDSGVTSGSVLAVSPTTISNASGTYTALANSTTTEFRTRILSNWIGGINYTLTMVNTNWSNVKTPIQIQVQSPLGTAIGSTFASLGGTSQISFTYPQGANGNIYIYIYYLPLGATPTFTWTTLSVVANILRSNLYSTKTALALNTTTPSFAGLALQSTTAPNGAGNGTTIENFVVGDVSAGTPYTKGYHVGFNAGNLAATITCQQTSLGSGTTFYDINSSAAYHSWKSRPSTANSVDMMLDYNAGNGGLRLNKNGSGRTTSNLLDVAGTISCDGLAVAVASTTHSASDSSYMKYGPNSTWSAYLTVGATPDRSGASNAQVITTNGNLHLDGGNSNSIYYGYYANSRSTPNTHLFYGGTYTFASIPENSAGYARVMCLDGDTLRRGQCMQKRLYQNGTVGWGGGINLVSAFYKWNQTSVVRISGKYSGYWGGSYLAYVYLRIHSQTNGADYGLYLPTFTNNGGNHVTIPLDVVYDGSELPTTGWFDLYIANSSGLYTDSNDQITLNVSVLPANSF